MRTLNGRRGLFVAAAIALLAAVAFAGIATAGEGPVKVKVGEIEFTADGGFKPTTLSKTKLTPIAFEAAGTIKSISSDPTKQHPPALKEVLVEADKNTAVTTKGYPSCKSGQLQSQDSSHAEDICRDAIIGKGTTSVEIAFPESKVVPVSSKLLVFNGGESGGVVTYYIHAYITVPVPAAIVTTVKIKKIHNGRYGLLATATIPKIAGGSGSVTSFSLKIDKKFTYKGKKVSVISAKCPDGKLQAHATAVFADGTRASTEIIRSCTGKG
jgi:hypothetical protein